MQAAELIAPRTFRLTDMPIEDPGPGEVQVRIEAVVVGPNTFRKVEMQLQGTVNEFGIVFQPDGLQRLFSLPTHELTDVACDVHGVLGARMSHLWQILGSLSLFQGRVRVVNEFFLRQAVCSPAANSTSRAVSNIVQRRGCLDIAWLADAMGVSPRQLARRFMDSVGISPKLFARIVRFQAALESKALHAGKSWTEIAHEFGYFDQMHMIHDFEQLAGGSPKEIFTHLEAVFVEQIRQIRSQAVAAASVPKARLML
jgi:AraC-like DNA-binding protein